MNNKRVYQVAKDFHISSEALGSMLKDLGFEVKSHMSVVDDKMIKSIKKHFEKQQDNALKDIQKKKRISEAIDKKTTKESKKHEQPQGKKGKKGEKPYKQKKPFNKSEHKDKTKDDTHKQKQTPQGKKKGKQQEKKTRSKSRRRKKQVDQAEVQETFKKTLSTIAGDTRSRPKKSRSKQSVKETTDEGKPIVKVSEFVSVAELASQMDVPVNVLIQKCLAMGLMVSLNHRLDMDSIVLLSEEFGYEVEEVGEYAEEMLKAKYDVDSDESALQTRPPVVTVMGHVDHGKTTLLDHIRKSAVVDTESGGITQHIGAYSVELRSGQKISFIDTPGHQAFTAMRARGAKVTDIVILIVGADDSVMPQTVEAIDHAKAAEVPIVIAINKIDLPTADPEKIKSDLSRHNILVEDWGGPYQCQEISAKKGTNTYELLEKVLLEAEMLELKANPDKNATGVVIEAHIDKGRGTVATVLVQDGTLKIGDPFISGMIAGSVRAMTDEKGNRIDSAGPSVPVQILGMDGVPKAGDTFYAVESEVEARNIAQKRGIIRREQQHRRIKRVSLEDLYDKIQDGTIRDLNLIIKADVDGSVEALSDTLTQITHEEVRVNVIHSGVGGINENDVLLAAASGAIIIGFHVRPTPHAKQLAIQESVDIKLYSIIYEAVDDVKKALSGLLTPLITEKVIGNVEVRDVFKVPKVGNIAGGYVTNGTVKRGSQARLIRDNIQIYEGKIDSLKRFKDDVTEVNQGYECGVSLEGYDDIKVGDVFEVFEILQEARKI